MLFILNGINPTLVLFMIILMKHRKLIMIIRLHCGYLANVTWSNFVNYSIKSYDMFSIKRVAKRIFLLNKMQFIQSWKFGNKLYDVKMSSGTYYMHNNKKTSTCKFRKVHEISPQKCRYINTCKYFCSFMI